MMISFSFIVNNLRSLGYTCSVCNVNNATVLPKIITEKSQNDSDEAKRLASQINFKVSQDKFV